MRQTRLGRGVTATRRDRSPPQTLASRRTPHKVLFVMRRTLLNFVMVASLVLLVASAVLWVRSSYTADTLLWTDLHGRIRELALLPGEIRLAVGKGDGFGRPEPLEHLTTVDDRRVLFSRRFPIVTRTLGVAFETWPESVIVGGFQGARPTGEDLTVDFVVHLLSVRLWVFVPLFSVLPLLWLIAKLSRPAPGHCTICGYDLRATPERCPECGLVAESAGTAA